MFLYIGKFKHSDLVAGLLFQEIAYYVEMVYHKFWLSVDPKIGPSTHF